MITTDELLASPVNLLAHLNKLNPTSALRDERMRAERAEELAIARVQRACRASGTSAGTKC